MVSFKRVFKTLFPRLGCPAATGNDDSTCSVPDLEDLTEVSGDDFQLEPTKSFKCKEDEDVAMFLSLVDRMAVRSLLFILQNHAREMHNITEQQIQQAIQNESGGIRRRGSLLGSNEGGYNPRNIVKKCRFAEILGGQQVRVQVFEIPHLQDISEEEKQDVWYSPMEQKEMRCNARKTVKYYQTHCTNYAASVRVLAESYSPSADFMLVEHHMKRIAQDPHGRGLEPHLCELPQICRAASVKAVLSEQEKQRLRRSLRSPLRKKGKTIHKEGMLHADPSSRALLGKQTQPQQAAAVASETSKPSSVDLLENQMSNDDWDRIRNCYRERTLACRTLALKLAECDHVEALKASLLRWKAPADAIWETSAATASPVVPCKQASSAPLTSHVAPLLPQQAAFSC